MAWTEVEELRFEIRHFNLDVSLGEQFNNVDKFEAVENQENQLLGLDNLEAEEDLDLEGGDVFFDVLLIPDVEEEEEFYFE